MTLVVDASVAVEFVRVRLHWSDGRRARTMTASAHRDPSETQRDHSATAMSTQAPLVRGTSGVNSGTGDDLQRIE